MNNDDDDDDENRVAVGHRDDSRVDTTPLLGVLARHTAHTESVLQPLAAAQS